MGNFKNNQLALVKHLGDVLSFSYDLQLVNRLAKIKPRTLVQNAEKFYAWQLEEIADNFIKSGAKIILVTGPSSAGKTTSSYKMSVALKKKGITAHVISMDDFFVNKVDTPLLPDGSYDFENVTAVDIPYFKRFLKEILAGKEALLPFYDFTLGRRTMLTPVKMKMNEVLIIEGLHALNPIFLKGIKKQNFYKVYVSVASNFTSGGKVVIAPKQIRLMRRFLRDYYKRGASITSTVSNWRKVVQGECRYISPFKTEANYILNTTHLYEPLLYDKYLRPILYEHNSAKEVQEILDVFANTGEIDDKYVPQSSLIREFLP